MTTKKQHLDPNAKRDWRVLTKLNVADIEAWLKVSDPSKDCPFGGCFCAGNVMNSKKRKICLHLFPEITTDFICPCYVLYVSDVKKVARQAIEEWQKDNV